MLASSLDVFFLFTTILKHMQLTSRVTPSFRALVSTSHVQGSLFAMASAFPPRYTQAMMAGQGLAGLTVALAGLFTTLAGPDDQSCIPELDPLPNSSRNRAGFTDRYLTQDLEPPLESLCPAYSTDWNTLAYFGFAVLVLVGCMVSFPVLDHLPLTAFYTRAVGSNIVVEHVEVQNISEREVDGENSDGGGWLPGRCETITPTASSISFSYKPLAETPPKPLLALDTPLSDSRVFDKDEAAEQRRDDDVAVNGDHATTAMNRLRAKLAPISRYGFAVFFSFAVTLSLFPGATSEIVSSRQCQAGRSRFFAGDVFTMFSFVSFNAFDLLGRLAAGAALVLPKAWLPTAAVSRLVFIPLLLSCRSEHSRFRYWLSADAFPLSIMPVFAFTNGYVSSLSMMAGSQNGAWAGTAMVLFLSGGLLAGCALSFLVLFASTKS